MLVAFPFLDEILKASSLQNMKRGNYDLRWSFWSYNEIFIYLTELIGSIIVLTQDQFLSLYERHVQEIGENFYQLTHNIKFLAYVYETSYRIGKEQLGNLFKIIIERYFFLK
ncbi:MAG: hypothetical protein QW757_00155 [Candidatus Woesearchaeota archaeon]